ncbi:MAG: zf-HC2 domain-containing protein [Acidobacteriales bacterium]|nr:zf-HC2 domain-containing protein [Terriglobales bacterium]
MNCAELEILLCDYLDGALPAERKAEVEAHLAGCASCASLAEDAQAAVEFIERAEVMEPPPELLTRILFQMRGEVQREAPVAAGARRWFSQWLRPVLQPKFAMGMAMTVLSLSMLGRFAGIEVRQLTAADLDPVKIVMNVEDRVHRGWLAVRKYYENLRLVYEIQTRIQEWTVPEEGDQPAADDATKGPATDGASGRPSTDRRERGAK